MLVLDDGRIATADLGADRVHLHRWRGARVKLLTEATCLQDAVPPHLERYLLRGRFDVEQTYQYELLVEYEHRWCARRRASSA